MFGNVVLEIPKDVFEHELDAVKKERGVKTDTDLDEAALRDVIARYKQVVQKKTGKSFPQDPIEQLKGSRNAVFRSWQNPRAKEYRRIYDIPDYIGTAVNVQQMVFGNTGDRSATGVGFTRSPATGSKEFYGEFLINAQGEDVVSGVRTPQQIKELEKACCRKHTSSCVKLRRASKSTSKDVRISSSRFRTKSSTCCRPAAVSARATRPS